MEHIRSMSAGARRFQTRRRRFLIVATAALGAVGIAMGLSFTADTGTATLTVSAGTSSSLVYPITPGATLPSSFTWPTGSALAYGTQTAGSNAVVGSGPTDANVYYPSWQPVAGAAGSIPTESGIPGQAGYVGPGDLFVVDGRSSSAGGASHITVNVYVTNLADLQSSYSSFAWPVDLYFQSSASPTGGTPGGTTGNWHVVDATHPTVTPAIDFTASDFYLTNTGGFLSYYLPTGADYLYEIALDPGGSYYTVNTDNLGPQFFVTAQAT